MSVRIMATATTIAVLALLGCQDDGPVGPTTQDFKTARQELATKLKRGKQKPAVVAVPMEASFGAIAKEYSYDPTGKRDPFRSFEWEQIGLGLNADKMRGPLEQFDVGQLSVVAVVWKSDRAQALIEDPSGMTYILGEGAKIGKNQGRVMRIADNLVVVKEIYVDFSGEETTNDIEMRIRGTEGG